jgi:glycine dehydrogenase
MHDVFNNHHSETSDRYIKRLERKDLSLNTLDDCLGFLYNEIERSSRNVTLSMPYWNSIHPFAPLDQVKATTMLKS